MKKLFGLYFLVYIISIVVVLMSCQKPTVSLPEDTATKKVYVQVVAYNNDGTSFSSEIEVPQ